MGTKTRAAGDGFLFLTYVGLIWLGMLLGFGSEIARRDRPYPLIVHVHSLVFVGWLLAFTAQIVLIRIHRPALHRRLGTVMAFGVALLAVIGPLTAYIVQHDNLGTPRSDPGFFSVQVGDVIGFVGLSVAALWLRRDGPAHKRLMLLALLQLSTAGFARWLGGPIGESVHFGNWGQSFWQTFFILHLTNDLMVLGIGAYDLVKHGRPHPAWMIGALWSFAVQAVQVGLYVTPAWLPVAKWILGMS